MHIIFLLAFTCYNPDHNILELYNILIKVRFTIKKRKLDIYTITNLLYEMPNDLRLRILGDQKILEKTQIWINTCPVSLQQIRLWQQQLKNRQKQISNFSFPIQFYWISLFYNEYFVRGCSCCILFTNFKNPTTLNEILGFLKLSTSCDRWYIKVHRK